MGFDNICNMPKLSFCIPTFNRSNKLLETVKEILTYEKNDIEIVISDNNSNDNTKECVFSIDDRRIKYFRNDDNLGGFQNMALALLRCQGEFIFFCLDKDFVFHHAIKELITILATFSNLSVGYVPAVDVINATEKRISLFSQGFQAIFAVAYQSKHPTGIIFKNELLKHCKLENRLNDSTITNSFLLEFLSSELCLLGDSAIIRLPIWRPELHKDIPEYKSYTHSVKDGSAYFLPINRFRTLKSYCRHISDLNLRDSDKILLVKSALHNEIYNAMFVYKLILNDSFYTNHYGTKVHHVNFRELIYILFQFQIRFLLYAFYPNFFRRLTMLSSYNLNIMKAYVTRGFNKYIFPNNAENK